MHANHSRKFVALISFGLIYNSLLGFILSSLATLYGTLTPWRDLQKRFTFEMAFDFPKLEDNNEAEEEEIEFSSRGGIIGLKAARCRKQKVPTSTAHQTNAA